MRLHPQGFQQSNNVSKCPTTRILLNSLRIPEVCQHDGTNVAILGHDFLKQLISRVYNVFAGLGVRHRAVDEDYVEALGRESLECFKRIPRVRDLPIIVNLKWFSPCEEVTPLVVDKKQLLHLGGSFKHWKRD